MQNLGGPFCIFFLRGPKSQLCKSYGVKTAIMPYINNVSYLSMVLNYPNQMLNVDGTWLYIKYKVMTVAHDKDKTIPIAFAI